MSATTKSLHLPIQTYLPYIYPPLLADVLAPLSLLPFKDALRVWILLQQVFLVGSLLLLTRSVPWLGRYALAILIILAANFYPAIQTIVIGQSNLLILLVLSAVLLCCQRGKFFWAGALIAVGAMLKVSPVLLLGLFALQRQWRAFIGFGIALVLLAASFVALNTPATLASFFTVALSQDIPRQAHWLQSAAPARVLFRLLDTLGVVSRQQPVWFVCAAVTLGILIVPTLNKRAPASLEFAVLYSIWVIGGLWISPITWEHHLAVLVLPLAVLFAAVARLTAVRKWLRLAVSYGILYMLLAVENVVLARGYTIDLDSGWWIFSGEFLNSGLFPTIRLVGLVGVFILALGVFRVITRSEPASVLAETRLEELPAGS